MWAQPRQNKMKCANKKINLEKEVGKTPPVLWKEVGKTALLGGKIEGTYDVV